MNRKILMLIGFVLVTGFVLIGYNKWVVSKAHMASNGVRTTVSQNSAEHVPIQQATPASSVQPKAAASSKENSAVDSDTNSTTTQHGTLKLVTKTITVVEAVPAENAAAKTGAQKATPANGAVAASGTSATRAGGSATPSAGEKTVLPVAYVSYSGKKLTVQSEASFTYNIFPLSKPARLVVDILGSFAEEMPSPKITADGMVKSLRLGHHDDRVRIVLDVTSAAPANWDAKQKNKTLSVVMR